MKEEDALCWILTSQCLTAVLEKHYYWYYYYYPIDNIVRTIVRGVGSNPIEMIIINSLKNLYVSTLL